MSDTEGAPVVFKKKGQSNIRKRAVEPDAAADEVGVSADSAARRTKLVGESAMTFKSEAQKKEQLGIVSTMSAVS